MIAPANSSVVPHYSLKDAVQKFFPSGGVSVSSLRTEIRKGHLEVTSIAGKLFVTEADIAAMLEACKKCQENQPDQDSISENEKAGPPYGLSSMERENAAQNSLNRSLNKLRKPSPITSAKDGGHHKAKIIPINSA